MKAVRAKTNNWTQDVVLILPDDVELKKGDKVWLPLLLGSHDSYPHKIAYVKVEID